MCGDEGFWFFVSRLKARPRKYTKRFARFGKFRRFGRFR